MIQNTILKYVKITLSQKRNKILPWLPQYTDLFSIESIS